MSKPIIIGYDGSTASELALRWGVTAASQRSLPVEVVTTWTAPSPSAGEGMGPGPGSGLTEQVQRHAEHLLAAALQSAKTYDPTMGRLVITGQIVAAPAARTLVAMSHEAALVVVGTHGRHGLKGMLLGSVSRQVLTHGTCPVAVVREPADDLAKAIVVGVDGSPGALRALQFAFDHASRAGLGLHIIHTWELPSITAPTSHPMFSSGEVLHDFIGLETRTTAEAVAGYAERWPDVYVEQSVVRGPAVATLVAESEHAALVIVGSRGHGGFVGLLLGSVSHGVAHHAHCPVVVVH